jgi:hypothetical protein
MKRQLLPVLLLVTCAGCETLGDRMAKWDDKQAPERFDAVKAYEETIRQEEERPGAIGGELSSRAQELLAALAGRARFPEGDPDPQVRAAALAALGRIKAFTDTELLRQALQDPVWGCRYEALHALRLKRAVSAIPDVLELLERSTEYPLIRQEAIAFIRDVRATEAIPLLVDIVTNQLERSRCAMIAWLALRELTGQEFSSEDFLAWERWYEGYRAGRGSQESSSAVGSTPAEGNGSGGAEPPANK